MLHAMQDKEIVLHLFIGFALPRKDA
jgi:hypothetical protein